VGSLVGAVTHGLETKLTKLLIMAANTWVTSNIPEEAPTDACVSQYLMEDVGSGIYKVGHLLN
jgi:hypothetical protein